MDQSGITPDSGTNQFTPKLAGGVFPAQIPGTMLIEAIRELNQASPFVPYEIRTNGGKRLRVPHPDFIMISTRGLWVIVTDHRDRPRYVSSFLIEEVVPARERARRK